MANKISWDCHMHSSFSADSETPMEQMILQGIHKGLKGICFTEHTDPDYPDTPERLEFSLDASAYQKCLQEFQQKYNETIELRFGVELGLQPHLNTYFHELLSNHPFDFVIGSSHLVHGFDPYYPEYFHDRDEDASYLEYFESILENLQAFHEMDVYGHLDYIVRYGPNQNRFYSYRKYQEILDEILRQLISHNVGIELNTGGFHYGLGEPNPCRDILRRYRELGGEIVTVGADAHTPEKIAYSFQEAYQILKDIGYEYYTVFRNRNADFIKL